MSNIITRDFTNDRINELVLFLRKCILICYKPYYPREAIDFFLDYHNEEKMLKRASKGKLILLLHEDKIIGTGYIIKDYIGAMYVDADYQNNGIGSDILDYLEMIARRSGIYEVKLDAMKVSVGFYERAGYKTIRRFKETVNDDVTVEYFEMSKRLRK